MSFMRRTFKRSLGRRRYKSRFVIVAEGAKTERQYFGMFNSMHLSINVHCLKNKDRSSPTRVLQKIKSYLKNEQLKKSDQAWLVVDKDQWPDEQLAKLCEWSQEKNNYGFAVSNPKFEYWLLLHFEDGTKGTGTQGCMARLRKHLRDYDKCLDVRKFTLDNIADAIKRAKVRNNPVCKDWPRMEGQTTVYLLVERMLATSNHSD